MNRQELEVVRDLTAVVAKLVRAVEAASCLSYKVAGGAVGAQLGGVSDSTIRRLIDRGELRGVFVGRHLEVSRVELERFLDEAPDARDAPELRSTA